MLNSFPLSISFQSKNCCNCTFSSLINEFLLFFFSYLKRFIFGHCYGLTDSPSFSILQPVILVVHFSVQVVPKVANGRCFKLFCILWHDTIWLRAPPSFLAQKVSQVHLVLFLPQVCNQPFLYGALLLSSGEWYLESKIWILKVRIATGMSWHLSPIWMDGIHIYLWIHVCVHMLCIPMGVYIPISNSSLTFPFNIKDFY